MRAYDAWMDERSGDENRRWPSPRTAPSTPRRTRAGARALDVPVLVLAGAFDTGNPPRVMAEVAAVFPRPSSRQEGAGHFPWVDDPELFVALVAPFVSRG